MGPPHRRKVGLTSAEVEGSTISTLQNQLLALVERNQPVWVRILAGIFLFLVSTGIYAAAGRNTPWPHLFYIPVIAAAAFFGYFGALVSSLAAGLVLGIFLVPIPDIGRPEAFNLALFRILFFLLVGGSAAFLFQQARLSRLNLEQERERSEQRVGELEALHEIDRAILARPDFDGVTRNIVAVVAGVMRAKICTLRLADPNFRELSLAAAYTATPVDMEQLHQVFGQPLRVGEGISGWTVLTGEPTAIADVLQDPRTGPMRDRYQEMGIRALLSTPVVAGGKILGALTVAYPEVREFPQEETSRMTRLGSQMAIAIQNAQLFARIRSFTRDTIIVLAEAIEYRDPYTGGHCERLGTLARAVAESLGLPAADIEQFEYAGILHDAGKIVVPDSVLLKPESLTPQEWALMRNHSFAGSQIAKKVSFLEPMAALIYHHHERYDGSGYLDGLAGESIPLGSRIIAVADAYDAMTHDRPYRQALSLEAVLEELRRGIGTQFDPQIVEAFLRLPEELLGTS